MATEKRTQYRSAVDGQFVKKDYAQTHPNTTVKERNPAPPPPKPHKQ